MRRLHDTAQCHSPGQMDLYLPSGVKICNIQLQICLQGRVAALRVRNYLKFWGAVSFS